jgi:hypothetical protein
MMTDVYGPAFFVEIPQDIQTALKAKALHCSTYRFFDVVYALHTDSPEVLDYFRQVYGHFYVGSGSLTAQLAYYVLARGADEYGPCLLWEDGRARWLPQGPALVSFAEGTITSSVLLKVRSHLILHGAAVSWEGQGMIIAGLTGSGKTTLTVELARRGFHFLSDEFACVSRETHQLEPFPKALGVRDLRSLETLGLDLLGLSPVRTLPGEDKWIVDIGRIPEACLDVACPPRFLILMETSLQPQDPWEEGSHEVEIVFRGDGQRLMEVLATLEGMRCGPIREADGFTIGRVSVRKKRADQEAFLFFCEAHQDKILYRVRVGKGSPDGSRDPKLVPLSRWEGSLGCLEHLQNLQFDGGRNLTGGFRLPVGILAEWSSIVAEMDCYRLLVGNITQTADRVCELVKR